MVTVPMPLEQLRVTAEADVRERFGRLLRLTART